MNREQLIKIISDILTDNVGNKLSVALATGIVSNIHQAMVQLEQREGANGGES